MTDRTGPLSEFADSVGDALLSRAGRLSARYQQRRGLESDLLESDDAYLVVFDAPGATSSDVQVRYLDGSVLVRLDRFRDYHEGYEMRFPGRGLSIDAAVELPEDAVVDAEAATATLTRAGTLEVELPKDGSAGEPAVDEDHGAELDEEADEGTGDDGEDAEE